MALFSTLNAFFVSKSFDLVRAYFAFSLAGFVVLRSKATIPWLFGLVTGLLIHFVRVLRSSLVPILFCSI